MLHKNTKEDEAKNRGTKKKERKKGGMTRPDNAFDISLAPNQTKQLNRSPVSKNSQDFQEVLNRKQALERNTQVSRAQAGDTISTPRHAT